jgi:uncharacterized membrane protein YdbT with pleckstrin-like domain
MAEAAASDEKLIWSGGPSQVVNLLWFLSCVLVITIPIAFWKWLVVKTTTYELTTERLRFRHGVLNRSIEQLELYRVRDYHVDAPLWLRLFSRAHIILNTSDQTHPVLRIEAIAGAEQLMDQLRTHVEACRVKKGVRDLDVS